MEPDEINPNPVSVHLASTGTLDPLAISDLPRITSFPEAIAALTNHPFTPQDPRPTFEILARTAEVINTADISNLQAARSSLNPSTNFLPYIATLHASLAVVENDSPVIPYLLSDLRALIATTPAHFIPPAHTRWVGACRHAARLAIETHHATRALSLIRPLSAAADKLAPSDDALVPTHADFLAVCLEAKCYRRAAEWIRERRRAIVPATGLTATDVHLIYHYSALVLVGVKDFRHALQCCRLALAVPAPSPGPFFSIALSTYKVFVLLNLLAFGKSPPPLKFSSYSASRMRKFSSEYIELAIMFEKMDRAATQQIFESNREVFDKQSNLGLVKQVMNDLSKRLIIRLTNSYVTMKTVDLARRAGLSSEQEAQAVLLNMIRDGKICASMDERKGIVSLMENDSLEEAKVSEMMSSDYRNHCLRIVQRVEDFRERLERDPVYIMKELASQPGKRPTRGSSSFGSGPSTSPTEMEPEYMSNGGPGQGPRVQLPT